MTKPRNTLSTVCTFLTDTFFPPSDEMLTVRRLSEHALERMYQPMIRHDVTMLLRFKDERVSALIHEAKFHHNKKALTHLGTVLAQYLRNTITKENIIIMPIPLSKKRYRARGYNQVTEVVKNALHELGRGELLCEDVLKRVRDTKPQTDLPRQERLTNIKGAFAVIRPEEMQGKKVLLIDDVLTTGATMYEARATLAPHASHIYCITLSG